MRESGTGRLSFFTLWQNSRTVPVVVAVEARLMVNAHLAVDAEWNGVAAWFISGSEARATVRARTTVWSMDSSVRSIVHDSIVADAGATGGFFGGDDSTSIEFNESLSGSGVAVPAEAYILIEVELLTEWLASNGSVHLDAESGSFRVTVPYLVLTETPVVTPPPPPEISLAATVDYTSGTGRVILTWSGATAPTVDIYRNGALFDNTANDGTWDVGLNPGTYLFRVCNAGSSVCSSEVSVTVNQ